VDDHQQSLFLVSFLYCSNSCDRPHTCSVRFHIILRHFCPVSLKLEPVDRLVETRPPKRDEIWRIIFWEKGKIFARNFLQCPPKKTNEKKDWSPPVPLHHKIDPKTKPQVIIIPMHNALLSATFLIISLFIGTWETHVSSPVGKL
jgi:hypothetical protein